MLSFSKTVLCIAAMAACSLASAAPVSLGAAGTYNLISLSDFSASNSSIGGAVGVAGNMSASGYSIKGSGAKSDSLVVGGNLNYSNASVQGQVSVGGKLTATNTGLKNGQASIGSTPLNFVSMAQQMQDLSDALARLSATGSTANVYGGLKFTGSNSAVEVFQIAGDSLAAYNWGALANLQTGSTVILNVSGKTATVRGAIPNLSHYNVLYNFYEAETLTISGTSLYGSILAPDATVLGGNGQINGNVVAGNWQSSITLNANHYFNTTEIAAYAPASAPVFSDRPAADHSAEVPEPGAIALMALALVLLAGFTARAKRAAEHAGERAALA